jgi:hypothetical protein
MLVVENQGVPFGGLVVSAQRAEVKLAEAALATVKVPKRKGRLEPVPRKWWQTKGTTVVSCDGA